jgi:spoIIIJ-associated protein
MTEGRDDRPAGEETFEDEEVVREAGELPAADLPAADPEEVGRLASDLLQGLKLDLQASAHDAGLTIEVDVSGPDRDLMLAHRAEALNALQYLLNRVVYRGRAGKKIHLDSEGYRRLREDEIVAAARRAAETVRAQGKETLLNPLNPYERRLVHLALNEMEGIGTRSIGDGFMKRIAVFRSGSGAGSSSRALQGDGPRLQGNRRDED